MKLKNDIIDSLQATEYTHPSQIFQSTIKGRKVAVKVIRLYVPRKVDEPLTVSTELFQFDYVRNAGVEVL